jgi:hypothetical protein
MTMQNPFGPGFSAAGLALPDPTKPAPKRLLSEDESMSMFDAGQLVPQGQLSVGTAGPAVPEAVKQRALASLAAQGMGGAPQEPVSPVDAAREALGRGPSPQPQVAQAAPRMRPAGGGGGMPSNRAEIVGAMKAGGEADQGLLRAQATSQAQLADMQDEQRYAAEHRMAEREARRSQRDQLLDRQMGQLQESIDNVSRTQFDSGRIFKNPGGVLMAIGAALGGGAAARVTGRNDGQVALQAALDRDFNEQKANAEVKSEKARLQGNLVQQMRSVFGDREQADLAAEITHKEMAAMQIAALGSRSKVPEIQAQAQKLAAEVRGQVATMKERWQQQAAATAAAVEEKMWKRSMELRKLQLEAEKIRGESGKEVEAGASRIASQVQSAKIPLTEAGAKRALSSLDKGASPLNTNAVANQFAMAFPLVYKFMAGDDAAASQQDYANFKNQLLHDLSGAAISDSEMKRLAQALEGSSTPADRRRAIGNALEALDSARANIYAGERPESLNRYQQRLERVKPLQGAEDSLGFTPGKVR